MLIHITCWILLCLVAALQLSQDNSYWPTLTAGFMLTGLYVFYSHQIIKLRISKIFWTKRKDKHNRKIPGLESPGSLTNTCLL